MFCWSVFLVMIVTGCSEAGGGASGEGGSSMSFQITSSAFQEGERIPSKYTCDGEDISPPLEWVNAPENTESLALIVDDPDAPVRTWDHWVLYNLPAASNSLRENVPGDPELQDGSRQGLNSWGRLGYGGPCPPSGTHRYFFRLYALDTVVELPSGVTTKQLSEAMDGHILEKAELMVLYSRR
jgi:Raf kinase inhibitor-like YbhB/YbcL family protein